MSLRNRNLKLDYFYCDNLSAGRRCTVLPSGGSIGVAMTMQN